MQHYLEIINLNLVLNFYFDSSKYLFSYLSWINATYFPFQIMNPSMAFMVANSVIKIIVEIGVDYLIILVLVQTTNFVNLDKLVIVGIVEVVDYNWEEHFVCYLYITINSPMVEVMIVAWMVKSFMAEILLVENKLAKLVRRNVYG